MERTGKAAPRGFLSPGAHKQVAGWEEGRVAWCGVASRSMSHAGLMRGEGKSWFLPLRWQLKRASTVGRGLVCAGRVCQQSPADPSLIG